MTATQSRSETYSFGWSSCPITVSVIVVAVGLHLATLAVHLSQDLPMTESLRSCGALVWQVDASYPELQGPFDLWRGDWWRIPLTSLHHTSIWQLLPTLLGFAYLGRIVEPQIDRKTFGLLILFGIFALPLPRLLLQSFWPTWLLTRNTFGLAGVVFLLFGFATALRSTQVADPKRLSATMTTVFLAALLAGLFFESLPNWPVDNLANLCGILLGWTAGFLLVGKSLRRTWRGFAGITTIAAIWLGIGAASNPVWSGRYHWWKATSADNAEVKIEHLVSATERDPQLAWPWYSIAQHEMQNGRFEQAWTTILRGYRHNKNFADATKLARKIWQEFQTAAARNRALSEFKNVLPAMDLSRQQLIPALSLAKHFIETTQPNDAWQSLVGYAGETPFSTERTGEVERLAQDVWSQLAEPEDRKTALQTMAERLPLTQRAWYRTLVPSRELIEHYRNMGELLWAWEAIIDELHRNPDSPELFRISREVWQRLPSDTRRHRARRIVDQQFGAESMRWQWRLGILDEDVVNGMRLDQSLNLPLEFLGENRLDPNGQLRLQKLSAPPVDADSVDSAVIGERL